MSDAGAAPPTKISFGFKKAVPRIGQGSTKTAAASSSKLSLDDGGEHGVPTREKGGVFDKGNALNVAPKSRPIAKPSTRPFGQDDDDNDGKGARSSQSSLRQGAAIGGAAPMSKAQKARLETAMALDASISDYDSVYDAMKAGERAATQRREEEKKTRDPKYMEGYLASAEQRKIDRQRAEAKKIQREREAEGEEFHDTESFVTDAYKKQMEEMRQAETEDKERDKEDRKKSRGVAGFYKDLLADQDRAHQAAVQAALEEQPRVEGDADRREGHNNSTATTQNDRLQEARRKGLDVRTNDDNEVVDERSLLSAGLNFFGKRTSRPDVRDGHGNKDDADGQGRDRWRDGRRDTKRQERDGAAEARALRQEQRARQSRMVEEQILALQKQRDDEDRLEQQQRKEALMGRSTRTAEHNGQTPEKTESAARAILSGGDGVKAERIAEAKRRALERRQQREKSLQQS